MKNIQLLNRRSLGICLCLLPFFQLSGSTLQVSSSQHPVRIAQIKQMGGFVAKRIDLNRETYLKGFPIDTYVDYVSPDRRLMGPVYQTNADYMGRHVKLLLTPFCNIGHWYRQGEQKPSTKADAFSYSIWLYPAVNVNGK